MTREEILALEKGTANYKAAELVLGWTFHEKVTLDKQGMENAWAFQHPDNGLTIIPVIQTPDFFDKRQAFILVDAMLRQGYSVFMVKLPDLDGVSQWKAGFSLLEVSESDCFVLPTAQEALLRAALLKKA